MRRLALTTVLALALTTGVAAQSSEQFERMPLPRGWQPEGIAAGPNGLLYVGSIATGSILSLDPETGESTRLGGKRFKTFALDGSFLNDLERLGDNFYVTDSLKPVIYRVARDLSGFKRIRLKGFEQGEGFGLNGIENVQRKLVAVHSTTGALWRIDPTTGKAKEIELGGKPLTNGDGLLLHGSTLFTVRNRLNRVAFTAFDENFEMAKTTSQLKSDEFDVPTTIARIGGRLFVVNARFDTPDPANAEYWVTAFRR